MLEAGVRLGPYEILALHGAGGMGEVYRARDTRLNRTVALKVVSPAWSNSEEGRQRFEREARVVSQISHPNVCTLFDVGRADDREFLVMETSCGARSTAMR
jgi:serine/threonine protein kinase